MAKKPVVVPQKGAPVKKKKNGCCGCLVGILVFVLVINIAGFFVGDYFVKKYTDMGLVDCAKILWDIRNVNSDKLITNPYSADGDLVALESELKEQMFLKESVDLNIDGLVGSLLPSTAKSETGVGEAKSTLGAAMQRTVDILNASETAEQDKTGLVKFVGDLFVLSNMDTARLSAYDESKHNTDYVFELTDKQLAALLNNALDKVLQSQAASLDSLLDQVGITDIRQILNLDQVIFEEVDGVISGVAAKVPALKLTISLDVRKIAISALQKQTGENLSYLVNPFLPKRLYVTAQVGLNPEAEPLSHALFINNMDEKAMNRIYKLVKGITKNTGGELDVQKLISDYISTFMQTSGELLNNLVNNEINEDFSGHKIKVDVFKTIIDLAKLNEGKEEANKLTAPDIIKTLGGIITSDAENAINKEHAWDNQYYDSVTDKVVYNAAQTSTTKLMDYKAEFMKEIAFKYMLNLNGADGIEGVNPDTEINDDITFDDIMALFGIGKTEGGKQIELLDLLDPSKLNEILEQSERKVNINDRMMGAILNAQISTLIGEGSIKEMNPRLEYVIMTSQSSADYVSDGVHNFIEMGLSVNVAGLLGESAGGMGSIISGLIGEKIVLVVKLDITPIVAGAETSTEPIPFTYEKTVIKYNDLSTGSTETILSTINKFGVAFDIDSLLTQIEEPVRKAISEMGSILPIKLCNSTIDLDGTFKNLPSAIELPSVFETIDTMLFKDDVGDVINADGIESVLRAVDEVNDAGFEQGYVKNAKADNYDEFMGEIQRKFYLAARKDGIGNPLLDENGNPAKYTFDMLFGDESILNFNKFDSSNFNFDTDSNGLFYDTLDADSLKPIFYDTEVAALILSKMQGNESLTDMLNILELSVNPNGKLTLIIKLDMVKLMGEANSSKLDLMPAKEIFIKATVNTEVVKYYNKATGEVFDIVTEGAVPFYETSLNVNNMIEGDGAFEVLNAMISHLNGGSAAFDLDAKSREIGDLIYGQLQTLKTSLGLDTIEFVTVTDSVSGEQKSGIQIIGFYDFLKKAIPAIENATANDIKNTLQGLEMFDALKPNDNNYKESDIVYYDAFTAANKDDSHSILGNPLMGESSYITDKYLGFMLSGISGGIGGAELKQSIITSTGLSITYKMNFNAGSGSLASVIPNFAYVTFNIPFDTAFGAATFTINSMTEAETQLLLDIAGVEQTDIDNLLATLTQYLGKFTGASLGIKGDTAMPNGFAGLDFRGYISYTGFTI